MIRLALLRHGHTAWNRAGQIQGRSDITLDDAARAELAGFCLPPLWDTAELWSSPLNRAIETARIVTNRAPRIAPELTEMDWGDWEGQRGLDLLDQPGSGYRHIENWGWSYRPPGGETPADVRARLAPWLASLTCDTVAICHIGIMRVLLAQACNWEFEGAAPFRIKRNRLFVLTLVGGKLTSHPEPVRLAKRP